MDEIIQPSSDRKIFSLSRGIMGALFFVLGVLTSTSVLYMYPELLDKERGESKEGVSNNIVRDNSEVPVKDEGNVDLSRSAVFDYTFKGKEYRLVLDNPDMYSYEVERQYRNEKELNSFRISITDDVRLSISLDLDEQAVRISDSDLGALAFDNVYRSEYLGFNYVMKVSDDRCDAKANGNCVLPYFHSSEKGSFSAFVVDEYNEAKTVPDDLVKIAEGMLKSYRIESR